jgi:hypothetical protein
MGPPRRLIGRLVVVSAAILVVLAAAGPAASAPTSAALSIHGGSTQASASVLCGTSGGVSCPPPPSCGPSTGVSCPPPSCGFSSCPPPSCGTSPSLLCTGTRDGTAGGTTCGTSAGPSCPNCLWVPLFPAGAFCASPPPPLCPSSAGPSCPQPTPCGITCIPRIFDPPLCLLSAGTTCPRVVVPSRCPQSAGTTCKPIGNSCAASAGPPCGIPKCVVSCRQLQVTPSEIPPGGTITVTGADDARCNKPGNKVTLVRLFLGNQAVDVIGSGGRFSVRVAVPAGVSAGNYPMSAECYGQSRGATARAVATARPIAWRVVTVKPPAHSASGHTSLVALMFGGGGGLVLLILLLLLLWALVSHKGRRRHNVAWVKEHLRAVAGSSPDPPVVKIRRRRGARSISLGLEPHDDHLRIQEN